MHAGKCLVKEFPRFKKIFLYTKRKRKCTLKSQEWMYFVWYKRVVCNKCKNVIKVVKNKREIVLF